jgi:GNAT superfamily N-acetyltransferase
LVMGFKLVNNSEEYYEFIRELRTHSENMAGFLEQVQITPEQQKKYMEKYGKHYYIALEDGIPVGWVGEVDDDIRVCTHPDHKGKGVGKYMIDELMKLHPSAHAKVLLANDSSNNLFKSCGFINYKSDNKFHYYKKENYSKPTHNPYSVVKMFEESVAAYTGAKYAVAVDSCTNALFLCLKYREYQNGKTGEVKIPSKTYLSVPQSIIHAGYEPIFDSSMNEWQGIYELGDTGIYDAAKRFTSDMYVDDSLMCLSFHIKKHLKIGKGGMILTNDPEAVEWFKLEYVYDTTGSFSWISTYAELP